MYELITALISDILKIPATDLTDEFVLRDAATWDSLRHMELIGSLEQSFGTDFTFDEIISMQSVDDICRILKGKGLDI